MTVVQLGSAGIWSPLQLRHSTPYAAAQRHDASVSPSAAMAAQRASPPPAGDWRARGAQLQGSVATHMAMARRAEEAAQHSADYSPQSAAALAAAAARLAAAAVGPAVLLSPVAARPLPSSQSLPMRGSFAAPAKLNRRDQLILSTFEWNLKPVPAYVPQPAAISPRSAPHDQWQQHRDQQQQQQSHPSGVEERVRNNMPDGSDSEPPQSHGDSRPLFRSPTRSGGADEPSMQGSRGVAGSAASSMRRAAAGTCGGSGAVRGGASISFAPSMSPLSQRTGDFSSLLGVTPMHTLAGSERAADRSSRHRESVASQLSYHASAIGVSDSSDLFSSPMAPAAGQVYRSKHGVSPARVDAHLAALAHARLQLQKEHAHARANAHARPAYLRPSSSNEYQSSSSSNSMLHSDGLSSDLSGGARSHHARSHRSVHAPVSSSDDSRWHSSAADTSSLLTLTHLSDSPNTNSQFW